MTTVKKQYAITVTNINFKNVENKIIRLPGIKKVTTSSTDGFISVEYDPEVITDAAISTAINDVSKRKSHINVMISMFTLVVLCLTITAFGYYRNDIFYKQDKAVKVADTSANKVLGTKTRVLTYSRLNPKALVLSNDSLTLTPSSSLVEIATVNGNHQNVFVKGSKNFVDTPILVVKNNIMMYLNYDMSNYDKPYGEYTIINVSKGTQLSSDIEDKPLFTLNLNFTVKGTYAVLKDGLVINVIKVVDNLNTVNVDKIRKEYIK